jgi:hypothetical protein
MIPTRENTLYLIIKQVHFDAILAGTKRHELREIKDTTFARYLDTWQNGSETILYFDKEKISNEELYKHSNNPMIYNNGVYPYRPIAYKFLELAVGYSKSRDTMIVKVEDIHFETIKDKSGNDARFSDVGERMRIDQQGELCIWQIVYTLGKIVETDLKKER